MAGTGTPLHDLTTIYDQLVDWPKRLAREEPFYRRLFERTGARRVLDMACGTGQHAAMFHSWGLEVEAADVDARMIDRARASFGEPEGLRFVVRGFDEAVSAPESFDVALCVGNSLALAPDAATAARAIREMFAAVRPGGALVVHLLNLRRLPDGPCVWQKSLRAALPEGEVLVLKGVHRAGNGGFVDLVIAPLDEPSSMRAESTPLLGLDVSELERMARQAGAARIEFLGDYGNQPYDPQSSPDLILTATK
jgi:SAM-dependent methyltransferase